MNDDIHQSNLSQPNLNQAISVITVEIAKLENEDFHEAWVALGIIITNLSKTKQLINEITK